MTVGGAVQARMNGRLEHGENGRGRRAGRQAHRERRARADPALDLDPPAVRLGDHLADCQAEPGPADLAAAGVVGAVEPFEDVGERFGRDAGAGVVHAEGGDAVVRDEREGDGPAGRGVAGSVVHEVEQELLEPIGVAVHLDLLQLADRQTDVRGLAAGLLVDVYQQARYQAPGVRLTIGELEQVEMLGDPDRLKQLLFNLVDNACRYTPNCGTVTLALVEEQGVASLSVRDTGPGIPPDEIPRIFERFYRADHARSREVGGTGLGLAISQVIAEAHGGRIEVDSRVGEGSTFTVRLPTGPLTTSSGGRGAGPGVLTSL